MDLQLNDRVALVTGSYRGTGAGIARVLAGEGAHVLVHGFEPGQPDAVVDAIVSSGGSAEAVVADITSDDGAHGLTEAAGRVDVLVNNFGKPMGSNWDSLDQWHEAWNVNVVTSVRAAQLCMPGMRDRGWGRIIFLGTIGTQRPGKSNPSYYGAKTALPTIVRTLAMELRGSGVTSNLVSPGMIATTEVRAMVERRAARDGVEGGWDAAQKWALAKSMPNLTERIPEPEDIGAVVAFLASDAAWHINGADLAVDGGARDAG